MQTNRDPLSFDDLDHDPNQPAAPREDRTAEIRRDAYVANGGEQTQMGDCQRCKGSGVFRGYTRNFPCKGCNGTGQVTRTKAAAQKAYQTQQRNVDTFINEHVNGLLAELKAISSWNNVAASMIEQVFGERRVLTEKQIEAARSILAKVAARRVEMNRERDQRRAAETRHLSGSIGVEAINALFATAMGNGLKQPFFRTEALNIKPAKKDARILYVLDRRIPDRDGGRNGTYVGKIVDGRFEARREAQSDTLDRLVALAADPLKAAVEYGRSTGICCCCGRELSDPVSVANGIGPICQSKWGM
jgi:hypothetical protein